MYAALARAVLDEAGAAARSAPEVERLRTRHPRASRDELAERLIRRAALQCAAAGALLTGPAAFFGAMPFGADLAWQVVALNRLVLGLSARLRPDALRRGSGGRCGGGSGRRASGPSFCGRGSCASCAGWRLGDSAARTGSARSPAASSATARPSAIGRYAKEALRGGRLSRRSAAPSDEPAAPTPSSSAVG